MTKRIFRSTLFVAAVVLLCSLSLIIGVLYDYFDDEQTDQLRDELRIAAVGTELEGREFLAALEAEDYRITWVAPDGTVLFDSMTDEAGMENHADRKEIREALETGAGSDSRNSATLLERTVYEAVRLKDGSVLRISMSRQTMLILTLGMVSPVIMVTIIATILSLVLSNSMSRRIVEPLNNLDLENPLENEVYEEIYPLLRRINLQHNQIRAHMLILKQKTDEFEHIIGNMQEGLVLLSSDEIILSINPTAVRLFGAVENCIGKSFVTVDRSREMRKAINAAFASGHGSTRILRDGRNWQVDLSRIKSEGEVLGAVVLAFDVTEAMNAERNRREFSANVSHELKTPLQSIIGSAELLEAGLVKPEDTARFVGHIRKEATRLVNLIEDIIRLSQLDEGVAVPMEEVDLTALCREAAATLQDAARERQVTVEVADGSCVISGVRRLLFEIVYNLCDNAIKYNVPGGSVRITAQGRILQVSDTGIGIPKEHQGRIFERFYRVDKSHSKQSGGTGLGLSIVKHAVQFHGAVLEMDSAPGTGTTMTIRF